MFGLFNKDNNQKEQEVLNQPEYLKLVEKWDSFLVKIENRFTESLQNAEEALIENLVESDYDINPSRTAWSGIKAQLHGLIEKIGYTFDESVEPQMLEYIERWHIIDQATKGTALSESLYEKLERFEIILEGKIAQKFYNHAIQFLNENFSCTQCGGQLEVKKDIFRSHYVSCNYCNTVNTFIPNDKIAQITWVATDIAKYKAINEWAAKKEAIKQYQELRSWVVGEDFSKHKLALEKREKTEINFWQKLLTERYALLPEYEETFEHDLNVKMKNFYEYRKREFNY